jgi:hypothetical protein
VARLCNAVVCAARDRPRASRIRQRDRTGSNSGRSSSPVRCRFAKHLPVRLCEQGKGGRDREIPLSPTLLILRSLRSIHASVPHSLSQQPTRLERMLVSGGQSLQQSHGPCVPSSRSGVEWSDADVVDAGRTVASARAPSGATRVAVVAGGVTNRPSRPRGRPWR